jgi:fructose-1,6-bisphosphatase
MAFLAEQAGGKASDGKNRILDIVPEPASAPPVLRRE